VQRRLPRRLALPLAGIFLLGLGQGALGWYMVQSGLADRVDVSQYRLVAHLALALLIYCAILWVALGLLVRPSPPSRGQREGPAPSRPAGGEGFKAAAFPFGKTWRRAAEAVIFLVALTIAAGGLVAGTHAGLIYNTFPLMDGRVVPADYAQLHPFIFNWFENVAAIQFDHRLLALATIVLVVLVWAAGLRAALPRPCRLALHALLAAAVLQVALGIATLMLVVPIPLAVAHQAGAIVLLTTALVLRHTMRSASSRGP
jgi:cytochrome c oxidase assembly protein subunit 15